MHKAGGIIALIAGILSIFALIFTVLFSAAGAVVSSAGSADQNAAYSAGYNAGTAISGYLVGGLFAIAVVLILSIVILNTHTRWPGIVMAIVCGFSILFTLAGGIVSVCLVFALIGALMSLNLGRTSAQVSY